MGPLSSIAISVGELSGDLHAANAICALKARHPHVAVWGMGGQHLRAAEVQTIIDSEKFASVMGFGDVFRKIFRLRRTLNEMKLLLEERKPDLLLLVDYPDFNLRLAKHAKKLGIPVMYYIPPKIWAWRSSRLRLLSRYTDRIAAIYPFEVDFYKRRGFSRITYVGHPFGDDPVYRSAPKQSREAFCRAYGLDPKHPLVAVFPGSRSGEIKRLLAPMLEGIAILQRTHPEVQAVVSVAPSLDIRELQSHAPSNATIVFVSESTPDILKVCDAGILKSGTNNLEAAFCGLPFACFYKASALAAFTVRRLVRLKEYCPVNIVRKGTVPELIQEIATPEAVSRELSSLLFDGVRRETMKRNFEAIVQELSTSESTRLFYGAHSTPDRVSRLIEDTAINPARMQNTRARVLHYLKPYTAQFMIALLCMIAFGASDGVVPFIVKSILDKVFQARDLSLLRLVAFSLVGFAMFRALVDFGQQFLMSRIGHHIVRDLRNEINRHLLSLSPGYFVRQSTANLVTRITSDVTLVRNLLTDCVASVLRDSVRVVTLLGAAIYLDPVLAFIAAVVFPIGILPVYRIGRRMRKLARKGQEAIGSLSTTLQESILGNRVVKIFGREAFEISRFEEENEKLNRTFIKSEVARALTGPINEVLAMAAICGVILYGGYSVISGLRSQGEFIAFLIAVFLLYDPFKKLSRINATVQQGMSGAERIFEILDTRSEIVDPEHPVPLGLKNTVEFDHVTFRYEGSDSIAVADVTLTIEEGKKAAIVGFSGAGKTTLIDLIPRFIDPVKGSVKIGGVDVSTASLKELRSRIALVGQHTFLFNDSVFNNIAYGHPLSTREEVYAAARAAYAYDFISQLPKGFDTMVGESGFSLSGGERQRIAIARAILKNAPILVLDEATASLDNRSEREVQSALELLEQGRTTVVIAHRLSTVRDADIIIVMKDGAIVEKGKHDELITHDGEYSKLYALQFRDSSAEIEPHSSVLQ